MSYHANCFTLSRAMDFFASAIYVALALKSALIFLSFLSKLILVGNNVWFLLDIMWRRQKVRKGKTWALEISSVKSPLENEQVLALVVEKWITVMRSFGANLVWNEDYLQYYKLDGNVYFIHFRLEISFLWKCRPKNQQYLAYF